MPNSPATLSTNDSLNTLVQAIDRADSAQCLLKAVRDLAEARIEASIPTLIAVLSYNNPGAAVAAVTGLVNLGAPAVPALMAQLDQRNYTAKAWAIRALAEIGDPRGLVTLLSTATEDFALSVRRAATKGLGTINWNGAPHDLLSVAQPEVLAALSSIAQTDSEWVVRYAAVVSLQVLAGTGERSQIQQQLSQIALRDDSEAVCARAWMAQQQLEAQPNGAEEQKEHAFSETRAPSLSEKDWQHILEQLQVYKNRPHSSG